jgi:hypothetical protein
MIWIPAWRLGAARNRDAAHRRRPRLGITAFRQGKNPQRPAAKSPLLEAIGRGGVKPAVRRPTDHRNSHATAAVVHSFAALIHSAAGKEKNFGWPKRRAAPYVSIHYRRYCCRD